MADRRAPRLRIMRPGLPQAPLPPCHTGLPRPGEPVTEKHLERALEIMAGIVMQHGECMAPLYVRLESELDEARRRRGPLERARQLLAAKTMGLRYG